VADQELELALEVVDDGIVHLVAAQAQALRDDDPTQRDDRHLAGAAPISTIMFPAGSATGSPAPIAAAIGSSIK